MTKAESKPGHLDGRFVMPASTKFQKNLIPAFTGSPFVGVKLDGAAIYKIHVDYASFPLTNRPFHEP